GVVIYGSEGMGLESSSALAQACANLLLVSGHTGKANNGLLAAWQRPNDQGAWDLGFRPQKDLGGAMKAARALYVVAADPAGDQPMLSETGDFLVVQDLFLTPTAKLADVVLPVQSFIEREGTFTNGERRVQRFYPAVPAFPGVLPDYAIPAMIGKALGQTLEAQVPSKIFAQICAEVEDYRGLSYARVSEVTEQWPIVGREDLFYGGTTYDNYQGLGVQLAPASQRNQPALTWPELPETRRGFYAYPITRLYDRGTTLLPTELLARRLANAEVWLHPSEAARLHVPDGARVTLTLEETDALATVRFDESIPAGVALIPRSVGIPIDAPTPVRIRLVERAVA
ncbi:MAG TPA: molybdopterin-dependent oxidoreductase, partial [Anaerolineales bacterium]|nr:molybdopterin-dependent oxidoreductase [Anaerolineales bacterium]